MIHNHSPWYSMLILLYTASSWQACSNQTGLIKSTGREGETIYQNRSAKRTVLQLADSSDLLLDSASLIRIPTGFNRLNREVFLEGSALFSIQGQSAQPFVIHTRAFVIRVNSPAAVFQVEGYPNSPGEETDLLSGILNVHKAYHSDTDTIPETLQAGEMIMINTDIDLMEKEKFDTTELSSRFHAEIK